MAPTDDKGCLNDAPAAGPRKRRPFSVDADDLTWLAVAAGVFLRVLEYAYNRSVYLDEEALLENLVRLPVFDLHSMLTRDQLAPPLYLVLGRLLVRVPWLSSAMSARLISLACGVASMLLMRAVARRYLIRQAVPLAVGLFALSDWLLYYSSEIKQYSCDAMLALVALLLAAGPAAAWASKPVTSTKSARLRLAALGTIGVWFSFPLAFVLAGIGTYLVLAPAFRGQWRWASLYLVMCVIWAANFLACARVSHAILSTGDFIWNWWGFAFMPLPPRSLADLQQDFWQLVNVFNSPADVVTPLGILPSALIALALFLVGALALARRWPGACWLLVSPFLFGVAASAMHQYPFHGRLLLYLVPPVHLLVAEGAAVLARRGGSLALLTAGAFLLYQPVTDAMWYHLIFKGGRGFDTHGDLRPDLLDHLERLQRKAGPS
jgi:hypothetical protein